MKTEKIGHGAFENLRVELEPGETFLSESGKMVRMSANVEIDITTKKKGAGGIMGGLKRLLGGDSFFFSTYKIKDGSPGEIVLAPTLVGNVGLVELDGTTGWMCTGGSYMASGPGVETEPIWQGLKGFMSGESLVFVQAKGTGPLVMDAFGCIKEVEVNGNYTVDTGHVVGFEDTLEYEITKIGGSWLTSFLAGEGFVMNFKGHGKVLIQSHNRKDFGSVLGPSLPERG